MSHEFNAKVLAMVQRDSIVMERLSAFSLVVDIYGHCGTSMSVQRVEHEIEDHIVPVGYIKQADLEDQEAVRPQNDYTTEQKLEMALSMARSLAVLHGFADGVIVHDDVQLCQWLRTKDDRLVLGDFNRAEIMSWNKTSGKYCKYNNGYAYGNVRQNNNPKEGDAVSVVVVVCCACAVANAYCGFCLQYRSPEEFDGRDLDEQIDIFSLGNNFYALLTGLWPFYENEDDGFVQVTKGSFFTVVWRGLI